VKHLNEQTERIGNDANNLTKALKGESKTQGDWGEMILKKMLENSGLRKDEEYFVQAKIRLSAPGKVLYSFSVDEDSRHRTVALLLETEDGTLYFADELKEYNIDRDRFTGLHWSRFSVEEGTRLSDLQEQN